MSISNNDYQKVFKAIKEGLVFSDEKDEDDFLVLVDENRELDDYKPKKALVEEMKNNNLIKVIEKETKREYIKFEGKKRPFPLISIYAITDKGKSLQETTLNDNENKG